MHNSVLKSQITAQSSMAENKKLHIAMFPWLAFGHMIPYLQLAKLIAQKGHKISFISTQKNIDRLPKIPPHLSPLINFIKFSIPKAENLPQNAEATIDVPFEKVKYLQIAQDELEEQLEKFFQMSKPDWILFDFSSYWVGQIAAKSNVYSAFFSIFTAAFCGFLGSPEDMISGRRKTPESFTVPPEWIPFHTTVSFRMFEILRMFAHSVEGDTETGSDMFRMGSAIDESDVVLVRSCYELDLDWLKVLENLYRKPVIPVGQLPTTTYEDENEDLSWREIKHWLDNQEKGKVVYVAFGSEAKPSQHELTEIALGLEKSELPFFWVLRKQRGTADTELTRLPEGFEERTKGRGMICTEWAPQLKIISHDSVGGFFTHSGWSSVVEAVMCERALILLTFLADQGINSKFLEEKGLGYLIPRDDFDGSFTSDSVAESLKLVLVDEEGRKYREKVKQMKGVFADANKQDQYMNNLLSFLHSYKK
jgi:UDP:flavonoid glycosyltransferase YjiC (YdhE family)